MSAEVSAPTIAEPLPTTWYLCQNCNKAFHLREKLNNHTRQNHPEEFFGEGSNNECNKTNQRQYEGGSSTGSKVMDEEDHFPYNSGSILQGSAENTTADATATRTCVDLTLNGVETSDLQSLVGTDKESQSEQLLFEQFEGALAQVQLEKCDGGQMVAQSSGTATMVTSVHSQSLVETKSISFASAEFESYPSDDEIIWNKHQPCVLLKRLTQEAGEAAAGKRNHWTKSIQQESAPEKLEPVNRMILRPRNQPTRTIGSLHQFSHTESFRKFTEELLTSCALCKEDIPIASFVAHVKFCNGPPNKCPSPQGCGSKSYKKNLVESTKTLKVLKLKSRSNCRKTFPIRPYFKGKIEPKPGPGCSVSVSASVHRKKKVNHPKLNVLEAILKPTDWRCRQDQFKWRNKCLECGERFFRKPHLEKHIGLKHGKFAKSENINESNSFTTIKLYEGGTDPNGLAETKSDVTKLGNQMHRCPHCPKEFSTKQGVTQHFMSHSDHRPFKCSYEGCTAAYKRGQYYREHLRLHTKETPFRCKTCGKEYARSQSFAMHKHSHTDYFKKFQCQLCGRKCQTNYELKRHHSRAHEDYVLA